MSTRYCSAEWHIWTGKASNGKGSKLALAVYSRALQVSKKLTVIDENGQVRLPRTKDEQERARHHYYMSSRTWVEEYDVSFSTVKAALTLLRELEFFVLRRGGKRGQSAVYEVIYHKDWASKHKGCFNSTTTEDAVDDDENAPSTDTETTVATDTETTAKATHILPKSATESVDQSSKDSPIESSKESPIQSSEECSNINQQHQQENLLVGDDAGSFSDSFGHNKPERARKKSLSPARNGNDIIMRYREVFEGAQTGAQFKTTNGHRQEGVEFYNKYGDKVAMAAWRAWLVLEDHMTVDDGHDIPRTWLLRDFFANGDAELYAKGAKAWALRGASGDVLDWLMHWFSLDYVKDDAICGEDFETLHLALQRFSSEEGKELWQEYIDAKCDWRRFIQQVSVLLSAPCGVVRPSGAIPRDSLELRAPFDETGQSECRPLSEQEVSKLSDIVIDTALQTDRDATFYGKDKAAIQGTIRAMRPTREELECIVTRKVKAMDNFALKRAGNSLATELSALLSAYRKEKKIQVAEATLVVESGDEITARTEAAHEQAERERKAAESIENPWA
jgi:hypothetical protein